MTASLTAFGGAPTPKRAYELSRRVEEAGFDRLWVPEGSQPVFSICTAAALSTSTLGLGTSVAVAFPRSPMLTAQAAWMLAQATNGNFVVGLGTQVRAHIERRYSAAFTNPGPRMREYVGAVRAIYSGFRETAPLKFEGEYYNFSLLPPTWSPGPMEYDDPPIYVAGVRPWMCRMIGEVADGMLVHPLSTISYLRDVVMPAVREGESRAGRPAGSCKLICPVMTAVSDDDETRLRWRDNLRARLAFYGSTPGYDVVFASSGWEGTGDVLNRLMRERNLAAMSETITDEMLDAFAITSTWDELPGRLHERFGGIADDIVLYSVLEQWKDTPDALQHWQDVTTRWRRTVI